MEASLITFAVDPYRMKLLIDILPVPKRDNVYYKLLVKNILDYPIVAHSDSINYLCLLVFCSHLGEGSR